MYSNSSKLEISSILIRNIRNYKDIFIVVLLLYNNNKKYQGVYYYYWWEKYLEYYSILYKWVQVDIYAFSS